MSDEETKSPVAKEEAEKEDKEAGSESESEEEKPKSKKRKAPAKKEKKERKPRERKKKEREGPKKPLSAYMFFSAAKRANVKEKHPNWKPTEVMKHMGELWGKASAEDKAEFEKQASEDKQRYTDECEKTGFVPAKKSRGGQPKGAKNAYNFYLAERSGELKADGKKFAETSKEVSKEWKEMKEGDKKKYEELAKADKDRFEKDVKDFEAKGGVMKKRGKGKKKSKKEGKKPAKKKQKKAKEESDEDDDAEKSAGDDED